MNERHANVRGSGHADPGKTRAEIPHRPRRRTVGLWLTSVTILGFVGVGAFAHHAGDASQTSERHVSSAHGDTQPLLSAVFQAHTFLRTTVADVIALERARRRMPGITLTLMPLPVDAAVPVVEQLQDRDPAASCDVAPSPFGPEMSWDLKSPLWMKAPSEADMNLKPRARAFTCTVPEHDHSEVCHEGY